MGLALHDALGSFRRLSNITHKTIPVDRQTVRHVRVYMEKVTHEAGEMVLCCMNTSACCMLLNHTETDAEDKDDHSDLGSAV